MDAKERTQPSGKRVFDARLRTPFSCIVSGPPNSGKTFFVKRLLEERHRLIDHPFDYIVCCYGQETSFITELRNNILDVPTTLLKGLPDNFSELIKPEQKGLIIIDDLMQTAGNSLSVTDLFCNKIQHTNTSVILLLQNLFYHGKERTTLVRCVHYLIIFKNPMDKTVQAYLSNKIMPRNRNLFLQLFDEATTKPHGYLFIDGKQNTPEDIRFRTEIFDDSIQKVFVVSY